MSQHEAGTVSCVSTLLAIQFTVACVRLLALHVQKCGSPHNPVCFLGPPSYQGKCRPVDWRLKIINAMALKTTEALASADPIQTNPPSTPEPFTAAILDNNKIRVPKNHSQINQANSSQQGLQNPGHYHPPPHKHSLSSVLPPGCSTPSSLGSAAPLIPLCSSRNWLFVVLGVAGGFAGLGWGLGGWQV